MHDPDAETWSLKNVKVPSKAGRKKIPEMWTRVISVSHDPPDEVYVYEIEKD